MTDNTPSTNGSNGRPHRGPDGRFLPGNKGGPGNPRGRAVARIREALLAVVTPEQAAAIAEALLSKARDGDVVAARELLDRTVGRPAQTDLLERIQRLEEHLESEMERWN